MAVLTKKHIYNATADKTSKPRHLQSFLVAGHAGEAVGLPVRGGLWEVDLAHRRMTAAYWPEPAHRVQRGTWFLEKGCEWVPLKARPSPA